MVLMPNTPKGGGISRKIFNSSDRQKIRNILNEIEIPKSMGVIVRTAGANKTKNEVEKDCQNTLKTWEEIRDKALNSNAPSLVYEEGDIIIHPPNMQHGFEGSGHANRITLSFNVAP